jgi:hypothetical protein
VAAWLRVGLPVELARLPTGVAYRRGVRA